MAKTTRTKEIWHIPKRGSVHQTIYMVYLLTWDRFLQKSWSSGKQEMIASEMGKAGLTEKGSAISHQSVRTLLANVPKYLGFVFIDSSSTPSKVVVTDIGYELIKHHGIEKVPTHKNLGEYSKTKDLIEISDIFNKQMSKLIITNPSIKNDCQNILVFPFRMTLRLLIELDYLDKEEIGYILFHTKAEDEYKLTIEKINNFRSLTPQQRQSEIEAYQETEEGKLTLVKAPTAGYYMYLCYSTGLCERISIVVNKTKNKKLTAIKLIDKEKIKKILEEYKEAEIYDFKDDLVLWKEYFSNPKRLYPPFDVSFTTKSKSELLVTLNKEGLLVGSDVLSIKTPSFIAPVFKDEIYKLIVYDLGSGNEVLNKEISFAKNERCYLIDISNAKEKVYSEDEIVKKIKEMFDGKHEGFDEEYYKKLKVIEKKLSRNYIDNYRKGGRLEYLFYELLERLKDKKIIDAVYWYGSVEKYGIYRPAPGGKEGNPDVVFEIDDYSFVLELTTYRGIRAQWNSAEASSVPDHIVKYQRNNTSKKVIGIFSAPSIHSQLQQNLKLNAKEASVGMLFKPCMEFAEYLRLVSRGGLLKDLISEVKNQLVTQDNR